MDRGHFDARCAQDRDEGNHLRGQRREVARDRSLTAARRLKIDDSRRSEGGGYDHLSISNLVGARDCELIHPAVYTAFCTKSDRLGPRS